MTGPQSINRSIGSDHVANDLLAHDVTNDLIPRAPEAQGKRGAAQRQERHARNEARMKQGHYLAWLPPSSLLRCILRSCLQPSHEDRDCVWL